VLARYSANIDAGTTAGLPRLRADIGMTKQVAQALTSRPEAKARLSPTASEPAAILVILDHGAWGDSSRVRRFRRRHGGPRRNAMAVRVFNRAIELLQRIPFVRVRGRPGARFRSNKITSKKSRSECVSHCYYFLNIKVAGKKTNAPVSPPIRTGAGRSLPL
jgi:hypothetical protein